MKPLILELGMGADVHGHDYTKAALRAISDAIRLFVGLVSGRIYCPLL